MRRAAIKCALRAACVAATFLRGCIAWGEPAWVPTQSDVAYGSDPEQRLDIYSPATHASKRAGLILIHGGGWGGGDKLEFGYLGHLAAMRGIVAIAINYRPASGSPRGMWPAQINDVEAALRWVRNRISEIGIDPRHICALGSSAGGHLVVLSAVRSQGGSDRIACVVDDFGPVDLIKFFTGPPTGWFGETDLAKLHQMLVTASPVHFVSKETPPTLIVQGTDDTAVKPEQSEALYAALIRAGAPAWYITYKGGHGFEGLKSAQYTALLEQELDFVLARALPDSGADKTKPLH